jgi:hypothetical protein
MDPTKTRFRYLVGALLTAIPVAVALRHVLQVHAGFTRKEIFVGTLAVAFAATLLTLLLRQGKRR